MYDLIFTPEPEAPPEADVTLQRTVEALTTLDDDAFDIEVGLS